jgi:hypothetical protein
MLLLSGCYGGIEHDQAKFAEIIETAYCVSKLHGEIDMATSILENTDLILGGDFMISNSSIECWKLGRIELIRLLCKVIQSFSLEEV